MLSEQGQGFVAGSGREDFVLVAKQSGECAQVGRLVVNNKNFVGHVHSPLGDAQVPARRLGVAAQPAGSAS